MYSFDWFGSSLYRTYLSLCNLHHFVISNIDMDAPLCNRCDWSGQRQMAIDWSFGHVWRWHFGRGHGDSMDVREIKGRFQKLSYGYVARFLGFVRAMTVPRCLMAVWLLCLRENGLQRLKAYPPPTRSFVSLSTKDFCIGRENYERHPLNLRSSVGDVK